MKKSSFILALSLLVLNSCFYSTPVSQVFSKYGYKDGVKSITIPGPAIRIFTMVAGLEKDVEDLLSNIDHVKVLEIEDRNLNAKVNLHKEFRSTINTEGFEELMTVHDENQDVSIIGKINEENVITELIILVGGEDNTLVYLRGHLEPEMLDKHINLSDSDKLLSFGGLIFK